MLDTSRVPGGHIYNGGTAADVLTFNDTTTKSVTAASYNGETGVLELTIGSHSYTTSNTVTITAGALSFTCSKDGHATSHTYPRTTDPAYNTALAITAVSGTTITVNVGIAREPKGFVGNSQRYINAADLIIANKDYIANEAVFLMKSRYPSFSVPGGEVNCEDDVRDILDAVVEDLRNGSNSHVWDAAALYVNRDVSPVTLNHVETEIPESVYTLEKAQEIVRYVINNTLWDTQGDHSQTQSSDSRIT